MPLYSGLSSASPTLIPHYVYNSICNPNNWTTFQLRRPNDCCCRSWPPSRQRPGHLPMVAAAHAALHVHLCCCCLPWLQPQLLLSCCLRQPVLLLTPMHCSCCHTRLCHWLRHTGTIGPPSCNGALLLLLLLWLLVLWLLLHSI